MLDRGQVPHLLLHHAHVPLKGDAAQQPPVFQHRIGVVHRGQGLARGGLIGVEPVAHRSAGPHGREVGAVFRGHLKNIQQLLPLNILLLRNVQHLLAGSVGKLEGGVRAVQLHALAQAVQRCLHQLLPHRLFPDQNAPAALPQGHLVQLVILLFPAHPLRPEIPLRVREL